MRAVLFDLFTHTGRDISGVQYHVSYSLFVAPMGSALQKISAMRTLLSEALRPYKDPDILSHKWNECRPTFRHARGSAHLVHSYFDFRLHGPCLLHSAQVGRLISRHSTHSFDLSNS